MNSKSIILLVTTISCWLAANSALRANETTGIKVLIPFEITSSGHQVVTLMYGEEPLRMILDTAAGANVLSQKAVQKLGLKTKPSKNKAAGLGTQAEAMAEIDPIKVSYDKNELVLGNLVAMDLSNVEGAGGNKRIDGLLGYWFFQKFKAKIDFATNLLTLTIN